MERKILIKDENYDEKRGEVEYIFREAKEKLLLTGTKKEAETKDWITLIADTNDLKVENLKTNNLEIKAKLLEIEGVLKINFENVEVESGKVRAGTLYGSTDKVDFKGENLKGDFQLTGRIKNLDLKDFDSFYVVYSNKGNEKCEELKCTKGKKIGFENSRGENKYAFIKHIYLTDIDEVNLFRLKLRKVNSFVAIDVKKLFLNIDTIREIKGKARIEVDFLKVPIKTFDDLEDLICFLKDNGKYVKNISFSYFDIPEKEHISVSKLLDKNLSLKEVLKIDNIEVRRFLLEWLGDIKQLFDKEKDKILIEKTEKGELWCIGKKDDESNCFKFLRYKDTSTDRWYISPVPPYIERVNEGFAWKFDIPEREYENLTAEA